MASCSLTTAVDLLQLIGEPTRVRLLALLATHELTVAEMVGVTQLAQSSVSTHLGKLREAALVRDRKSGPSTFYSLSDGAMPAPARRVWELVRGEVHDALLEGDGERASRVVRARDRAAGWPDAVAGEMERHWSPGRTWESLARAMACLVRVDDVIDVGSGDGSVAQLLAPRAAGRASTAASGSSPRLANGSLASPRRRACASSWEMRRVSPAATRRSTPRSSCTSSRRSRTPLAPAPRRRVFFAPGECWSRSPSTRTTSPTPPAPTGTCTPRRMLTRAGLRVDACDVTSRDARPPCFRVVTALATKPERGKP